MIKVKISINGRKPFASSKREDIERLFEQMAVINNGFHKRPNVFFSVTSCKGNRTTTVNWNYFDTAVSKFHGTVFTNQLVDELIASIQ